MAYLGSAVVAEVCMVIDASLLAERFTLPARAGRGQELEQDAAEAGKSLKKLRSPPRLVYALLARL